MKKGEVMKRKVVKNEESDDILLEDAFEEFILEKEIRNCSKSTLKNYKSSYKRFKSINKVEYADEVKLSMVYKFINTLKLEGISVSAINHYLGDIRAFFYWCMVPDRAYIKQFKIQLLQKQEEPLKLFNDEEIEKLLKKPSKSDTFVTWRTWAIVNWVLATGNRASTIISIRIGDIDNNRKEIVLPHTKNKKAQVIPLSSSLEIVIKEYKRIWRKGADNSAYLFPNIGEEQLTTSALRKSFDKYCKSRDVSHANIHGLRHSFAKGWVQNNGNMFVLQKVLGHSSLEMTRRYVKLFSEDMKEDFDRFNPLDTIKKNQSRTKKVTRA